VEAHFLLSDECPRGCAVCPFPTNGRAALDIADRFAVIDRLDALDIRHLLLIGLGSHNITGSAETVAHGLELGLSVDLYVLGTMPDASLWPTLAAAPPAHVLFEILGDRRRHDAMAGEGSFDEIIAAIAAAANAGLEVGTVLPVLVGSEDLHTTLPTQFPSGIKGMVVQHYIPFLPGQQVYAAGEAESVALWRRLSDAMPDHLVLYASCARSPVPGVSKVCSAGRYKLSIAADGTVIPCEHFRGSEAALGNILTDDFEAIWSAPLLSDVRDPAAYALDETCAVCDSRHQCSGCRAAGYNHYGDARRVLPVCLPADALGLRE
jgi:radical SAM protein with 4Fe4S-binding SPASM domain